MDRTLRFATPFPSRAITHEHAHEHERVYARFLNSRDVPALLDLEHEKWNEVQAASEAQLRARIEAHPDLAVGAFCPQSDRLLASLFMRPVADDFHRRAQTWQDYASLPAPHHSSTLFGISLTSRDKTGVSALLEFFWPHALKRGWRHIYLGSPVPGLRQWLAEHPEGRIEDYVRARRAGLPLDPQLRYYGSRGFSKIVAVKANYFPHHRSLDFGVLLRGTIPLSGLRPLWASLPLPSVRRATRLLAGLL
ncbi:hypothetical protein DWV00_01065 [Trinickia dinghuensis]|uniref:GNAT family N-acetyltransferase n=1 Tax=Trinickia dinghuensis TaxID=2291023 RepID=A0A3D8K6B1_9BURK|nr:hypothetical protein DWV00_01065 [Trinickia dinghuensis]